VMEFEVTAPNTVVTARNRNRSVFASAGAAGGNAGKNSRFQTHPDTERQVEHGNIDVIKCGPGDVVRLIGPGAGGYGPARERSPQSVLRDVQCGFVTVEGARRDYGVVIVDGDIDAFETEITRSAMPEPNGEHFDYGSARSAFEAVWTRARYAILTEFLATMPVVWRHFLKHQVFAAVSTQPTPQDEQQMARQMAEILHGLTDKFPAIRGLG
jgi:N-methylhydantoinase B